MYVSTYWISQMGWLASILYGLSNFYPSRFTVKLQMSDHPRTGESEGRNYWGKVGGGP